MKNYILLIFLFAFSVGASAQVLSFSPEELTKDALSDVALVEASFDVGNETSNDLNYLWKLERADVADEWTFTVCDSRLCHEEGKEACPTDKENSITADGIISGFYKVTLHPYETPYDGHIFFVLHDVNDTANEYARMRINFNIEEVSSTYDIDVEDLIVYPNPTSDFFQVKNDANVSSISIYNIIGKKVNSFKPTPNRMYNVSNLETGIYLVRFYDEKLNTLRAIRFTKN